MRIAWFSPMPPERSGIADYSALVLPAIRDRIDVDVVRRGRRRPPRGVDLAVYHVGNNPDAHGWIVDALERVPGLVVLHEVVLHHLVSGMTLGRGDARGYLDALEREGGLVARLLGHAVIEKRIPPLWESRAVDYPLVRGVLDRATGLVVHSRYVEECVRAMGYRGPVHIVPHAAWPDPGIPPAAVTGEPLVAAFGNINASKRVPQLLEAFARVRARHPGARLLLVGEPSARFDLEQRLQRLGLEGDGIEVTGFVDETRLWALMAAADVHVALRHPTMGETSGTVIRALALGKPLVVSDVGWFSELPGEAALKVAVDEHEVDSLAAAIELLATRSDVRAAMGVAAAALASGPHAVERVAEEYVAAFEEVAGGGPVADAVLGEVSAAAAAVGIAPGTAEARELAQRLREVDLGA